MVINDGDNRARLLASVSATTSAASPRSIGHRRRSQLRFVLAVGRVRVFRDPAGGSVGHTSSVQAALTHHRTAGTPSLGLLLGFDRANAVPQLRDCSGGLREIHFRGGMMTTPPRDPARRRGGISECHAGASQRKTLESREEVRRSVDRALALSRGSLVRDLGEIIWQLEQNLASLAAVTREPRTTSQ
jgi:hypothetical protein